MVDVGEAEIKALVDLYETKTLSAGEHLAGPSAETSRIFLVMSGLVRYYYLAEDGNDPGRVVIIEFPSLSQAEAFYHSQEYQTAKGLRDGIAIAEILAVEGLD